MGSRQTIFPSTGLFIFADDITISVQASLNCNNIVAEFNNILSWSASVKLILNEKKTQKMTISCSKQFSPTNLPLDIENQHRIKLRGIYISSDLQWDFHVNYIRKKCSSRCYAIRVLKPLFSQEDLLHAYSAFVRCLFDYCAPLLVGLKDKNNCVLNSIENRFHNLICGFGHTCSCL